MWPLGRGREGLFVPEQPRFGIALWYHLDNVAWAGPRWPQARGRRGHQGTLRSCPPAVAWPHEEGGGLRWHELGTVCRSCESGTSPFHRGEDTEAQRITELPQITPGRV